MDTTNETWRQSGGELCTSGTKLGITKPTWWGEECLLSLSLVES